MLIRQHRISDFPLGYGRFQVIDVIDRFLSELGVTANEDNIYEQAHLPKSGQAFLWASMLVRFKADTLEQLGKDEK